MTRTNDTPMTAPSEEIRRYGIARRIHDALADTTFTSETWDDQDYEVLGWRPRSAEQQMLDAAFSVIGDHVTLDDTAAPGAAFYLGGDECQMRLDGTTLRCTRWIQRSHWHVPEGAPDVDFTVTITGPADVEDAILRILYPTADDYAPRHLAAVTQAVRRITQAHEDRDEAIRAARAAGETIAAIARAAGMTRQSIYTILNSGKEQDT